MAKSIRVTLSYEEAEAILVGIREDDDEHNRKRLRGRGKISSALFARRDYITPLERAASSAGETPDG